MNVVHEANAKNLPDARGNTLKDAIVTAEPDDAAPLQGRNSSDGHEQNSRSGHHPACGVICEKTSSLGSKAVSQSLCQLDRRLFRGHCVPDKLFHAGAALENPGAIRTGSKVLQHILVCLNVQFVVQVRIEIPAISLAGSVIEIKHFHKHPPVASCPYRSHWRSPPVSPAAASGRGSSGTSLFHRNTNHLRDFLVDRKSTRLNSSHRTISYAV